MVRLTFISVFKLCDCPPGSDRWLVVNTQTTEKVQRGRRVRNINLFTERRGWRLGGRRPFPVSHRNRRHSGKQSSTGAQDGQILIIFAVIFRCHS